jgi:tripartite-type tricarboxylate transporter receptor subunit TctC
MPWVLGITAPKRVAAAPDIPTRSKGGLGGFDLVAWQGVVPPAGVPWPIVHKPGGELD